MVFFSLFVSLILGNVGRSEFGVLIIFGSPGAHLGGPGAHFDDFGTESRAKNSPDLEPIFIQKSAKSGKRTVRMLKSEVRDAS